MIGRFGVWKRDPKEVAEKALGTWSRSGRASLFPLLCRLLLAGVLAITTSAARADVPPTQSGLIAASASTRSGSRHDLLAGVLAARRGDDAASRRLLRRAVKHLAGADLATAWRYLAYDAAHLGDTAAAADFGARALATSGQPLTGNDLDQLKGDVDEWRVYAREAASETLLAGPTTLPIVAAANGRIEVMVRIGGLPALAMLDTGAGTVLSSSLAKRLGLHSQGSTGSVASTGVVNQEQLAVLPELALGTALLRRVRVGIGDDAALQVGPPGHRHQLDLIIGYEALRTLGAIEMSAEQIVLDAKPSSGSVVMSMFEDGYVPSIAATVYGRKEEMVLDTGANGITLNKLFYEKNAAELAGIGRSSVQAYGRGGSAQIETMRLPTLGLDFNRGTVTLHNVLVLPNASQFDVRGNVGNAGRALWADFKTATLDFRRRTLTLR